MKKFFFILTLLAIAILLVINAIVSPIIGRVDGSLVPEINVNLSRIESDVEYLSTITPTRSYSNLSSLNKAADYISQEFKAAGFYVEEQEFQAEGNAYKNLIATFGKTNGPRWIIGAHYDSFEGSPGADDNASGVSGLLEIARLLRTLKPEIDHRIDLVAYSLEEPPFFRTKQMGSYIHAAATAERNPEVIGMICLDMIGYYSHEKVQDYPLGLLKLMYPSRGDFITVVGKTGQGSFLRKVKRKMHEAASIDVRSISAPRMLQGIDFSDHLNYWNFGYNAVMVNNTGFYRNQNYHTADDKAGTLDYFKMSEVIKGVYWTVVNPLDEPMQP